MRSNDHETGLTLERVKEVLRYDPSTGIFTWLIKPRRAVPPGTVAGSVAKSKGYRLIKINYRDYQASRLAWLYMTGAWPTDLIDHINGNKADNRFVNLREATGSQNGANRGVSVRTTTGIKGVYFKKDRGVYHAKIGVNGHFHHLGVFASKASAAAAYENAARDFFGSYARSI